MIILVKELIRDNLKENTLSFVNAMPKDINTRNMVAYAIRKVAFSRKTGVSISKYKKMIEAIMPYIGPFFISILKSNSFLANKIPIVK